MGQAPDGPEAHGHGVHGFNDDVETEEGRILEVERVIVGGAEVVVEEGCIGLKGDWVEGDQVDGCQEVTIGCCVRRRWIWWRWRAYLELGRRRRRGRLCRRHRSFGLRVDVAVGRMGRV